MTAGLVYVNVWTFSMSLCEPKAQEFFKKYSDERSRNWQTRNTGIQDRGEISGGLTGKARYLI